MRCFSPEKELQSQKMSVVKKYITSLGNVCFFLGSPNFRIHGPRGTRAHLSNPECCLGAICKSSEAWAVLSACVGCPG